MAHGDAREGKCRGNWRMEWVASTLHTTSENGVSSITTDDGHTSAVSSRLNWRSCRFKWARPFHRKTKFGFCACAITFQTQSTTLRGKGVYRQPTSCSWVIDIIIVFALLGILWFIWFKFTNRLCPAPYTSMVGSKTEAAVLLSGQPEISSIISQW